MIGAFSAESGVNQIRDGITSVSIGASYITGGLQHLRDGVGGAYALRLGSNQNIVLPFGGLICREAIVAFPLFGQGRFVCNVLRGGVNFQGGFQVSANQAASLVRGESGFSTTTLATGTTGYIPENIYSWVNMRYFVDNSAGLIQLRVHSYANVHLSFTGDTQNSASFNTMDAVLLGSDGVAADVRVDDVFVFVRTLYFDTALGITPVAGATITDTISGATAVVDFTEVDGTDGVAVVYSVNGTFGAGNAILSGAWTAVASNDLGNDRDGLWVPEAFSIPGIVSSDVSVGWTGATGGGTHYTEVDDWYDTATYVYTALPGQLDQYGVTPPSIPVNTPILGVIISTWAQSSGSLSVTQVDLGYNDGIGNIDGPDQVLPSSYGRVDTFWTNNARTGVPFTLSEIAAINTRQTSVA